MWVLALQGPCSDEGLTLETSANTLFGDVQHPHINLTLIHFVHLTATPTQTKTSSHRD